MLHSAEPLNLRKTVFRTASNYPIFKVAVSERDPFPDIFVSRSFADVLIESKLTGSILSDPAFDSFEASILGIRHQNVVPGITT
jgi:hypothetical protein